MPDDPKEKPAEGAAPPAGAPAAPPQSNALVNDNQQKQIRTLEEKISKMEVGKANTETELSELRAIVKKLGELPAVPSVQPAPKGKTLLEQINDLLFAP